VWIFANFGFRWRGSCDFLCIQRIAKHVNPTLHQGWSSSPGVDFAQRSEQAYSAFSIRPDGSFVSVPQASSNCVWIRLAAGAKSAPFRAVSPSSSASLSASVPARAAPALGESQSLGRGVPVSLVEDPRAKRLGKPITPELSASISIDQYLLAPRLLTKPSAKRLYPMPEESKFAGTLKRLRRPPEGGGEQSSTPNIGSALSGLSAAIREAFRPGLVANHHPDAKSVKRAVRRRLLDLPYIHH